LETELLAAAQRAVAATSLGLARIEDRLPPDAPVVSGKDERQGLVVGVEQDEQRVVHDRAPVGIHLVDRIAGQAEPEAARERAVPVLLGHLAAIGTDPREVLHLGAADPAAEEELPAPQHRMALAQPDDEARELQQLA